MKAATSTGLRSRGRDVEFRRRIGSLALAAEKATAAKEAADAKVSQLKPAPEKTKKSKLKGDVDKVALTLKDVTGIELCRQIRTFDPSTPILICSGAVTEADIEAAMLAGAGAALTDAAAGAGGTGAGT